MITNATVRYWESNDNHSIILSLTVAPNATHDDVWTTETMLGLPKGFDPDSRSEQMGDREKIYDYFRMGLQYDALGQEVPARPLGPCVFALVATSQPQPYCAIRAASQAVMARYALTLPQG